MSGISSSLGAGGLPPTTLLELTDSPSTGITPVIALSALSANTVSASTQTPVDISVGGVLEYCAIGTAAPTLTASLLKITIDGVIVYNKTGGFGPNIIRQAAGTSVSTASVAAVDLANMVFRQSLKIEFASDGTNSGTCYWRYYET